MKLGRIDFETTSNIGIITGGLATNIVPDSVILKGEARSHDPKSWPGRSDICANALSKHAEDQEPV